MSINPTLRHTSASISIMNIRKRLYTRLKSVLCILTALLMILPITGCNDDISYADDPHGNFDALAEIIDTRYCFFRQKNIDWQKITSEYRSNVKDNMSDVALFMLCADMLNELQDGHVNLISRFNTSYYRKWWSDYPQDFDLRTLQEYYLKFSYFTTSGISYAILPGNIGYMYYPSFSAGVSDTSLDYILALLHDTDALIIDIRDNGGGLLTNIDKFVGRFIDKEIPGGFISHKTGPGHNDFSEPYPFTYKPAAEGRIKYLGKKICLLTNRSCYSAANTFAAVMKSLPQVTIIGARTGGGGGLPFSSELPNGWGVRFSASPLYDPEGNITEFGVDPTEGFECHAPAEELAAGHDAILDLAIKYLTPEIPEE